MKNIKVLALIGLLFSAGVQAVDDFSDWVLIPSGNLIFKNDLAKPIELVYSIPTARGPKQGILRIEAKKTEHVDISAYQLFSSDLAILWNNHNVVTAARKHLGETFTKKYNVPFKCDATCCKVACQSEQLIRSFMAIGKRFTTELEAYKKSLANTKVKLEFSQDAKGSKVTTHIGGFSEVTRF